MCYLYLVICILNVVKSPFDWTPNGECFGKYKSFVSLKVPPNISPRKNAYKPFSGLLSIVLDRPHDYSKKHYNVSRDQPTKAAKPRQKLTKGTYPFVLLP